MSTLEDKLREVIGTVLDRFDIPYDSAWSMPVTEAIAQAAAALGAAEAYERAACIAQEHAHRHEGLSMQDEADLDYSTVEWIRARAITARQIEAALRALATKAGGEGER